MKVACCDILLGTLSKLEPADPHQTFYVSKEFCKATKQSIRALCSVQHSRSVSLNHTEILYEFDTMVQNEKKDHAAAETTAAFTMSLSFGGIQSVLRV